MPTTVLPTPMSDALAAELPPGADIAPEAARALEQVRSLEAAVARLREDAAGPEQAAALLAQVYLFRMALQHKNNQEET